MPDEMKTTLIIIAVVVFNVAARFIRRVFRRWVFPKLRNKTFGKEFWK